MKKIVIEVPDSDADRLSKAKELDGYKDKRWDEWLLSKAFPRILATDEDGMHLGNRTLRKLWYNNLAHNLAYVRRNDAKTFRTLLEEVGEPGGSALIVGGGPSIQIHNHLQIIKDSGYKGTIITTDKMLIPLLQKGVVPDYVMSVDGSTLILPFFKHKLFEQNKTRIRVILHMFSNPKVVRYLYKQKANIYWFLVHTEYTVTPESDIMAPIYMTTTKHNPQGVVTCVAGGNCGNCSWSFAWSILKKNPVILCGIDLGYPQGTDLGKTSYYSSMHRVISAQLPEKTAAVATNMQYDREYNPDWGTYTYTDTVFKGYRKIWSVYLEMLPPNVQTINATEGGAFRHPRLKPMKLAEALSQFNA